MPKKSFPPTTLADFADIMDTIAPPHLAESWDNVGILSGPRAAPIRKILLAIDLTPAVFAECLHKSADLLLVYHPPIFKPLKTLRSDGTSPSALALQLASHKIWIYSPHTALDTATNGTNDALAAALGATVTGSFSHYPAKGQFLKLVAFIPEPHVEQVADALFAAGAGNIGQKSKYSRCSFRTPGHGTFQGDESSNPAVGVAGHYEVVPEIRFETILPAHLAGDVISALRSAHPYEEPAFDLLRMETPPEQVGLGRYASLPKPEPLAAFAARIKSALNLPTLQFLGNPRQKISTLALVAGAAGTIALDHAAKPYDCLITGELKHHEQLAYLAAGKSALLLGHSESERPILPLLAATLKQKLPSLKISIARSDHSPLHAV